jgi:murein DD-endopeptidase MepM/ murein hydrolase activator NlpD
METPSRFRSRLLLALPVILLLLLALLRVGAVPDVEIEPALPGIGPRTPVAVRVTTSGRGLGRLAFELLQEDRTELLAERVFEPRPFWAFWGARVVEATVDLEVGSETVSGLREGEATLRVTAERAPTWLRHPDPAVAERELPVRLKPPRLEVTSRQNNLSQGGSGVVTYKVGEGSVRDGVRSGERFFPGCPSPDGDRFAIFAAPHDLDDGSGFRLMAADELGNRAESTFLDGYRPRPLRTDTIRLDDVFMARVVPEILAHSPALGDRGELLANYLAVNGDLRTENAAALVELSKRSRPRILWRQRFLQQPDNRVMAAFAERRTYLYQDREVDRQDHLGFDLASVRRAPVEAANDGIVRMAEYFGIYGNTVVLDHGCGLASLYAHLSSIGVEEGQQVSRGDVLGRSGETGLAGGDHLHYSMLVHGVQVDPLEWWDGRWIRDHVAAKLGAEAFELDD